MSWPLDDAMRIAEDLMLDMVPYGTTARISEALYDQDEEMLYVRAVSTSVLSPVRFMFADIQVGSNVEIKGV